MLTEHNSENEGNRKERKERENEFRGQKTNYQPQLYKAVDG